MSKAFSLLGRSPSAVTGTPGKTYEVSLIKKMVRCRLENGQIAVFEPIWIYTGVVMAPNADAALESALYEYFTEHIIRRWSRRRYRLNPETLMNIDLWANDLVQATRRRIGHPSQVIHFAIYPWEPDLFTIGFERSL